MNAVANAGTNSDMADDVTASHAHRPKPMPWSSILPVLVGLPAASTLLSCLLLAQDRFPAMGLDFRLVFWPMVAAWYVAQIAILGRVLKANSWQWRDIGYGFNRRQTVWLIGGYLLFAIALVGFVEFALRGAGIGPAELAKLSDFSNLTPQNTMERAAFVLMGLVAAPCEELVYRGFAINALRSRGWSPWLAVPVAAVPFVFQHGLKSLDHFWWFFAWGLVFGVGLVMVRRLYANIVMHWLVILSALFAILQVLR
ncbi:MAG: type II CAAX endopeptidase family protein [Thermomonas sp.]